jgi:hypothetical protein
MHTGCGTVGVELGKIAASGKKKTTALWRSLHAMQEIDMKRRAGHVKFKKGNVSPRTGKGPKEGLSSPVSVGRVIPVCVDVVATQNKRALST